MKADLTDLFVMFTILIGDILLGLCNLPGMQQGYWWSFVACTICWMSGFTAFLYILREFLDVRDY